jgi:hypothetical protein
MKSNTGSFFWDTRYMFDVELYLTVHKSFVSTSLNIVHRRVTFLNYPYWAVT